MSFVRDASQDLVYDSGTSSYVSANQSTTVPTNGPGPAVFVDNQGRALVYNGKALVYGEYEDTEEEWTPDSGWWDIKSIINADTRSYAGKAIILYSNAKDTITFTISSPLVAVETSDGYYYTSTTTHTWDKTQDKPVSGDESDTTPKLATRYVKYYFNTATPSVYALYNLKNESSLYALFDCDLNINYGFSNSNNGFFYRNYTLIAFDFLNNHKFNLTSGYSYAYFCNGCYSLTKLPDVLDTSNSASFSSFCSSCYSLKKLPDILDTSSGTSFDSFCSSCNSLKKLPDVLDVSHGTIFSYFCYYCFSLETFPKVLDLSSGTGSLSNFCSNCYCLRKLPDVLDVSGFNNFSSFCAFCYALEKLPDILDVSSGTNFSNFCRNCTSLTKLPDVLDVSNGTNFYQALQSCYALKKLPNILDFSSVTNSDGLSYLFAYCYSLEATSDVFDLSGVSSSSNNSYLLYCCYSLVKANIKLQDRTLTSLSSNTNISVESLKYIADNAPTVSGKTLTLGSTLIAKAGGASGTIITTLTNKGWTVN